MMSLPRSSSEGSSGFDLLHPQIQRWIRQQGWSRLRDVQEQAIAAICGSDGDVLISAATAAGKTEAAFLPLLGSSAARKQSGISLLYVAPLKALINDQFRRLEELCDKLELPLVRWHGDAPQGPKNKIIKAPSGVVLITPESIEAMLLRRSATAEALFGALDAIIIDELHSFLQLAESTRGIERSAAATSGIVSHNR